MNDIDQLAQVNTREELRGKLPTHNEEERENIPTTSLMTEANEERFPHWNKTSLVRIARNRTPGRWCAGKPVLCISLRSRFLTMMLKTQTYYIPGIRYRKDIYISLHKP